MVDSIFPGQPALLTMFYYLTALAEYILDPFGQLRGDDIDG